MRPFAEAVENSVDGTVKIILPAIPSYCMQVIFLHIYLNVPLTFLYLKEHLPEG